MRHPYDHSVTYDKTLETNRTAKRKSSNQVIHSTSFNGMKVVWSSFIDMHIAFEDSFRFFYEKKKAKEFVQIITNGRVLSSSLLFSLDVTLRVFANRKFEKNQFIRSEHRRTSGEKTCREHPFSST